MQTHLLLGRSSPGGLQVCSDAKGLQELGVLLHLGNVGAKNLLGLAELWRKAG